PEELRVGPRQLLAGGDRRGAAVQELLDPLQISADLLLFVDQPALPVGGVVDRRFRPSAPSLEEPPEREPRYHVPPARRRGRRNVRIGVRRRRTEAEHAPQRRIDVWGVLEGISGRGRGDDTRHAAQPVRRDLYAEGRPNLVQGCERVSRGEEGEDSDRVRSRK